MDENNDSLETSELEEFIFQYNSEDSETAKADWMFAGWDKSTEEDSEGDDLFGGYMELENMANPRLDRFDPAMLDDLQVLSSQ